MKAEQHRLLGILATQMESIINVPILKLFSVIFHCFLIPCLSLSPVLKSKHGTTVWIIVPHPDTYSNKQTTTGALAYELTQQKFPISNKLQFVFFLSWIEESPYRNKGDESVCRGVEAQPTLSLAQGMNRPAGGT